MITTLNSRLQKSDDFYKNEAQHTFNQIQYDVIKTLNFTVDDIVLQYNFKKKELQFLKPMIIEFVKMLTSDPYNHFILVNIRNNIKIFIVYEDVYKEAINCKYCLKILNCYYYKKHDIMSNVFPLTPPKLIRQDGFYSFCVPSPVRNLPKLEPEPEMRSDTDLRSEPEPSSEDDYENRPVDEQWNNSTDEEKKKKLDDELKEYNNSKYSDITTLSNGMIVWNENGLVKTSDKKALHEELLKRVDKKEGDYIVI